MGRGDQERPRGTAFWMEFDGILSFFFEEVGVGKRSTIKLTDGVKVGNSSKTQQMRTRTYIFREVHSVSICSGNFGNCPDIMCHLISPQANGGFEMIYMYVFHLDNV